MRIICKDGDSSEEITEGKGKTKIRASNNMKVTTPRSGGTKGK